MGLIDKVIVPIDKSLKDIDDQRKAKKLEWVKNEIKKIAFEFGLKDKYASEIDIKAAWLTKSCSESKCTAEIKNACESLKIKQQTHEQNKALIVESCHRLGESPTPWLELLENKYDVAYIIRRINEAHEKPTEIEAPKIEETPVEVNVTKKHVEVKEHVAPMSLCREATEGEILTYRLELQGTRAQLNTIRKVMQTTGVKYKKI